MTVPLPYATSYGIDGNKADVVPSAPDVKDRLTPHERDELLIRIDARLAQFEAILTAVGSNPMVQAMLPPELMTN